MPQRLEAARAGPVAGPDATRSAPPGPALALRGAGRAYGPVRALRPLTLEIRRGERVALLGPSGAGKSTLLRLLDTSLAPSEGMVEVLGQPIAAADARRLRALRARIGTVHQQLLLVPQATTMQNVVAGRLGRTSLARTLAALVSRREAARVRALLDDVGIGDKIFERVDRLSGGEQQRVAIARTLYQDPELILADEPLASVDPARAADIAALLARAFAGRTLVVSTHRIEPLLAHVDRVVALRDGALAFDKPAAALTLRDLGELYEARRGAALPASAPAARPPSDPEVAPGGTLRIGASSTPGEHLLPSIVRAFARAYPGTRVSLSLSDSAAVTEAVRAGTLDLGFVGAREEDPSLAYEDVARDEIVLVAAPALELPPEPIALEAAVRLPRVDREPGSGTRAVVEQHLANMGAALDPAAVVLEAGALVALKAAVVSGMGVAFVSRRAIEDDLRGGHVRVVRVEGLSIPRHVFAVLRRDPGPGAAARAFLEVARAEVPP
ncbi:ABC transporter-related protein [Anaeromyxobacter sp. K]|uniref:LysR substrate-binding domain-containing protein n=1 Tax=Anaeromyxobacter sp. (strain K) TaxID=447217 RepID=UPI00017BE222|nr:LysR substrate-binding domain-containing protein [Anaeromyxobacter sp. K]ACG71729.1 ABC transporter-related protein [Anaeromyxobacter sp. K]